MHRLAPSPPVADDPASPRLVLRDGTVATVRRSTPEDREAMRRFFHELSPESRRRRFFTAGEPADTLVDRLCDSSDGQRSVTLVAVRMMDGDTRIIAVGSYLATDPVAAEAAFAVDDRYQGKGLATELLERLAAIAADHGFRRFDATTLAENNAMLAVFRDSGFEVRSKSAYGTVEVALALTPSAAGVVAAETRRRHATAASLRPMLEPRAIAVVGASRDPGSLGRRILDALVAARFNGPVYPVNPAATEIAGLTSYASVRDVPDGVDLGVVAVPRERVLAVVNDCAAAGVKSLVVITAGYAEAGDEGRALQHELVERVRGYGMRMVGPNCMGLLNADPGMRLNASFSPIFPSPGRVALSSQSGALGLAILALAANRGVGLSTFVSVGNKADVSSNDLLEYWEEDETTSVILLYLESFGNPRHFARLARRIGRSKPIVAVKAGRMRGGFRAADSHTEARAANDVAVDALFHQSGVIRADTIDEMFDIAACLEAQPLPAGRRVAIVTNARGPGVLAVDACESAGLVVAPFSAETRARLASFLPAAASTHNPVDMVASAGPDEYRQTIEVALTDTDSDALIVIFAPVDVKQSPAIVAAIRDGIVSARHAGATLKPILACVMADPRHPQPLSAGDERVPAYAFPENAARALARIATYAEWRAEPPGLLWGFDDMHLDQARAICRGAADARGEDWLTDEEMRRVLNAIGLPLAAGTVVHSADAALASAGGIETIVSVAADRLFGPLIGFGLGGIYAELMGDVRFRIAPLTDRDADELLHEIRGFRLLDGYRGRPAMDVGALRGQP
jgi:acetate---CoA ligase (ADP-forming)